MIYKFKNSIFHIPARGARSDSETRREARQRRRYSSLAVPALLAVLLAGIFAPIPVYAASVTLTLNPSGAVDQGRHTLNFSGTYSGVGEICGGPNFVELIVREGEGGDLPRSGASVVYRKGQIHGDQLEASGTFAFELERDFDADSRYNYIAFLVCTNGVEEGQSALVSVHTQGTQAEALIPFGNIRGSWSVEYSVYAVPADATSITFNFTEVAFRLINNDPREFLRIGDRVTTSVDGGAESRARVSGFRVAAAAPNSNPKSWGCDGTAFNRCAVPQRDLFGNPESRSITFDFTTNSAESNTKIFVPQSVRDSGEEIALSFYPIIVGAAFEVDMPVDVRSGQITIRFDAGIDEQADSGGSAAGAGGLIETNETTPGLGESLIAGLLDIVNISLGAIMGIFRWIVWILGTWVFLPLLETTLSFEAKDLAGGVILSGWTFVRDVVNMIFILLLIVIGLGTILRIESYNYKKLLVNLIVMALLVNFSLVIGRIILEFADTIQFTFLPKEIKVEGQTDGISGIRYVYQSFMTTHITSIFDGVRTLTTSGSEAFAATMTIVMQALLEIGVVMTFGALAIFMLIRTVAIWILLILSPLAYALMILPSTAGIAKQWWTNFIKYAFFAPIMAFFIRLTLVFYQNGLGIISDNIRENLGTAAKINLEQARLDGPGDLIGFLNRQSASGSPDIGVALEMMLVYVIILGFLWGGLLVTRQLGIYGADTIIGVAQKGMAAPLAGAAFAGRRLGGYLARKYNEATGSLLEQGEGEPAPGVAKKAMFAILNPVNFARGWEQRAQELKEISKSTALAGGREVAEQFQTGPMGRLETYGLSRRPIKGMIESWRKGSELKLPYRQFSERADENKFMEDYTGMRKESLMRAALQLKGMGGAEGSIRRRAVVKAAASQGYLDDLLRMKDFANEYASEDGTVYSAEVLNRFLHGYLGHDEQAMRFMAEDMEELGKKTGHFEYLGHAYYDPAAKGFKRGFEEDPNQDIRTGRRRADGSEVKFKALRNSWQADYSSGELAKVSGRERLRIAPHNFVAMRAELKEVDGKTVFADEGDELKDISFGTKSGEMEDFFRAILSKISAGDLREIHHAQSRTPDWLLSQNIDPNTGEVIVESESEYNRIKSLWESNPEFMRAIVGHAIGMTYAEAKKQITGVKVAYYQRDAAGNLQKKKAEPIGHPDHMKMPLEEKVPRDVAENPDNKVSVLSEGEGKELATAIRKSIPDLYAGNMSQAELVARITPAIPEDKRADANPETIANDVYKKIADRVKEGFEPYSIIQRINSRLAGTKGKQQFTKVEIQKLTAGVRDAVDDTFREIRSSGSGFTASKLQRHILARINDLDSREGLGLRDKLTDRDVNKFVARIVPTETS